jgi:hypothetical protein
VLHMTGQRGYWDCERGLIWFHMAAEQGLFRAIYNLHLCYTKGIGVRRDSDETLKWIHRALEVAEADRPRHEAFIAHRRSGGIGSPAVFQADPRKG